MDEEIEKFSNIERFCLVFCQLQPNVADKSAAYKKGCISFVKYDMVITAFFSNNLFPQLLKVNTADMKIY